MKSQKTERTKIEQALALPSSDSLSLTHTSQTPLQLHTQIFFLFLSHFISVCVLVFFEALQQHQKLKYYSLNGRYLPATMKISGDSHRQPPPFAAGIAPSPDMDLRPHRKTSRRKPRTPETRFKRSGTPAGRRSRPETPSSRLKIADDRERNHGGGDPLEELDRRKTEPPPPPPTVSARKLAAGLWRLQLPELAAGDHGTRGGLRLQVNFKPSLGSKIISFSQFLVACICCFWIEMCVFTHQCACFLL